MGSVLSSVNDLLSVFGKIFSVCLILQTLNHASNPICMNGILYLQKYTCIIVCGIEMLDQHFLSAQ